MADFKYKLGDRIRLTRNICAVSAEYQQNRVGYLVIESRSINCFGDITYRFVGERMSWANNSDGWVGVEENSRLAKWSPRKPKKYERI
jgi:hypothetical protein